MEDQPKPSDDPAGAALRQLSELHASLESAHARVAAEVELLRQQLREADQRVQAATDAARDERERRERAEDELLSSIATRLLERDALALETQAREEALFMRLADIRAQADAAAALTRPRP